MTNDKLDFWIKQNMNVLFIGKHGTGKTTRIIDAFERNKLKWLYFSAATLDPWVDFVGVPREAKDANGNTYLDLVRPKHFSDDSVEAIFFDEYNRSLPKIRNATMELIQFKSINGKKFKNLRLIWAAINPESENDDSLEYDVEKLDPAQKDRFQIHISVPYVPDYNYFKSKYGETNAKTAIEWWKELGEAEKNLISPRRLDYALNIFSVSGDMRDVLPSKANVAKLLTELQNGSFRSRMLKILNDNDIAAAKPFICDENCYNNTIKYILKEKKYMDFFFELIPDEKKMALLKHPNSASVVTDYMFANFDKNKNFILLASNGDSKINKRYSEYMRSQPIPTVHFDEFKFRNKYILNFSRNASVWTDSTDISQLRAIHLPKIVQGTPYRIKFYNTLFYIIYDLYGYKSVGNPQRKLTELEITNIITDLNSLIESSQDYIVMSQYNGFHNLYGTVLQEYLNTYNKKADFKSLGRKVKEYFSGNAKNFV